MWTCPKCGTQVDSSFEVCWACGTTAEGVEDPNFRTADETGPIELDEPAPKVGDGLTEPELPEPPLELVEGYRARDGIEAQFLVDRLAETGIPAVVVGVNMGNIKYPVSAFAPRVMVRSEDLDRARHFFEDYDERRRTRAETDE